MIIFILSCVATLAISLVLPAKEIHLTNGVIESFAAFFTELHLRWLTPVLAAAIAFGAIATLSAWLVGPARGMRHACEAIAGITKA